jgi:hypothetical protein
MIERTMCPVWKDNGERGREWKVCTKRRDRKCDNDFLREVTRRRGKGTNI